MGLRINTNVASIAARNNLRKSEERVEHSISAVASGNRIVRPGDDPAGLAIGENLRGQVASLKQARRNSENAISLVQVAEGGLNEQNNIIIRLRELSIQAASDNVSDVERKFLDQEYQQLTQEFDRIAKTTRFGNVKLLDGSGKEFVYQVGAFAGPDNQVKYNMDSNSTSSAVGISGLDIKDQDDAIDNIEKLDKGLTKISELRANFGAIQSRLAATTGNLDTELINISAARSRIADADLAEETANIVQATVLQEAGVAVLAQANNHPARAIRLISTI